MQSTATGPLRSLVRKRLLHVLNTRSNSQSLFLFAEKAMDRDNFMSAQEAVNFGLIDRVLMKRENLEGEKSPAV